MNYTNENVEFIQSNETQKKKQINKNGILIYQEAKTKLQISNSGKIYKQKVLSYIPIIGPLFSTVYANLCVGKTRCLRTEDSKKFKSAGRIINWFAFLVWPIIFLGIWTLIQYLLMDFSVANGSGRFVNMWANFAASMNTGLAATIGLTGDAAVTANFNFIASIFNGLFQIFIEPLVVNINSPGQISGSLILNDLSNPLINTFIPNEFIAFSATVSVPCNVIFIMAIIVLTWINPVNILNSFVMNTKKRRFTIIVEDSSVYQYRNR